MDLSHSYKASFLKAPVVPPTLLWIAAMVTAFLTISIIPEEEDEDSLNFPPMSNKETYLKKVT